MNQTEFISIIIPTWNSAQWITRCLDSVTRAADAECEIIVVDDGSTDDTVDIVRSYEERDPRLCLITCSHGGCGEARKQGVMQSQGDSVIFVDSDDTIPATLIADYRRLSAPDVDIVIGNMSLVSLDGTSRLTRSGARRSYKGIDFAEEIMLQEKDFRLMGKKFKRSLFDNFYWDSNIIYGGMYHRMLLLQLACAAKGKIIVDPGVSAYTHYDRPWSLSSMLWLRTDGIARLWQNVRSLPVSEKAIVSWGLNLLWQTLIERGIPFDNEYTPAVELREMLKRVAPAERTEFIIPMIYSRKERLKVARRLLREGILSTSAPHISFIITAHNNTAAVRRSVQSIMETGFRNIEIILIDDGSDPQEAIALNALSIMTKVMHFKKLPRNSGRAKAREEGLKVARGFAVMFLDGGDRIEPTGVIEALNQIDSGAHVAFMGARRSRFYMGELEVDPGKCRAIHEGAPAALENITTLGETYQCSRAVLYLRDALLGHVENVPAPGLDDLGYIPLILARVLTGPPRIGVTSAVGVFLMSKRGYKQLTDRIRYLVNTTDGLMRLLKNNRMDNPGRYRALISGFNTKFIQILARQIVAPISGRRRAERTALDVLGWPETQTLYADAGMPVPSAETLVKQAAAYYRRHRLEMWGTAISHLR